MRVFTTECKDSVTGYAMVLSECSYNMACDWLERTLKKYGRVVWDVNKYEGDDLVYLRTGEHWGNLCRTFVYDESRGFLMGD